MCFGGKAPAAPAVPGPPPAPVKFAEKRVQAAGTAERARGAAAGGRASTILTGPLGLPGAAQTQQKTLLGG